MSYAPKLEKSEGVMNWSRSAIELWNQVRGLYEWPGAVTTLAGEALKVHVVQPRAAASMATPPAGEIVAIDADAVRVATGQGSLDLLELQLPGKQRVRAVDLARGRVLRVGDRLGT
jgi:methionyl-tRNA formyltransferase